MNEPREHFEPSPRPCRARGGTLVIGRGASLLVASAITAACGFNYAGTGAAKALVLQQAETDLDCPQKEIQAEQELGGRWFTQGCGRHARYNATCDHLNCSVSKGESEAVPWRDRPDPDSTWPK